MPGGKGDSDETPLQTAIRETLEETGIVLQKDNVEFLKTVYVRYPECDFVYHMFKSSLLQFPKNILLNPNEHTQYRLLTIDESLDFDLILGEHECIELVRSRF